MRSLRPHANLLIACLAQNIATGLTFGSIGLLIEPLSRDLHSTRGAMSLSIALVLLVAGVMGPWVGRWVDRWSLRGTLAIGALLSAMGFYVAAHVHSMTIFLCSYGLLVGAGFAMAGYIPANKIAALWFPDRFGSASAVANLPLAVAILPPVFAYVLRDTGWRNLLQVFAIVELLLFFLFWLVSKPAAASLPAAAAGRSDSMAIPPYRLRRFWVLSLAVGLVTTSGIATSAHVVPFAQSVGIPVTQAALLLSLTGVLSVVGALFFGWCADRATPFVALSILTVASALAWLLLPLQASFAAIAILTALLGFAGGGLMPAVSVYISRLFSAGQFGATLGQLNFATLPFTFAAAPLLGLLYDWSGNYRGAFALEGGMCIAALSILFVARSLLCGIRDTEAANS